MSATEAKGISEVLQQSPLESRLRNLEYTHDEPLGGIHIEAADVLAAITEWCKWQNTWAEEVYDPCGLPRPQTRTRLQKAGRRLFEMTGVQPCVKGLYGQVSPCVGMDGKPPKGMDREGYPIKGQKP